MGLSFWLQKYNKMFQFSIYCFSYEFEAKNISKIELEKWYPNTEPYELVVKVTSMLPCNFGPPPPPRTGHPPTSGMGWMDTHKELGGSTETRIKHTGARRACWCLWPNGRAEHTSRAVQWELARDARAGADGRTEHTSRAAQTERNGARRACWAAVGRGGRTGRTSRVLQTELARDARAGPHGSLASDKTRLIERQRGADFCVLYTVRTGWAVRLPGAIWAWD